MAFADIGVASALRGLTQSNWVQPDIGRSTLSFVPLAQGCGREVCMNQPRNISGRMPNCDPSLAPKTGAVPLQRRFADHICSRANPAANSEWVAAIGCHTQGVAAYASPAIESKHVVPGWQHKSLASWPPSGHKLQLARLLIITQAFCSDEKQSGRGGLLRAVACLVAECGEWFAS